MDRAALSGRLLGTRPGVCSRCTHVSVSQVGSWLVHKAPWWPWQDRGQKEPCSCACLQLHLSVGAIFVFLGRVERRREGWWWLVLDGTPSDSSMWCKAAVRQLHAPRAHSCRMLVGSRSSGSGVSRGVVCGCVCVYPCLCSGASSMSSCTSIIMLVRRRCRLSLLRGFCFSYRLSFHQSSRLRHLRSCRSRRGILRCRQFRRCLG